MANSVPMAKLENQYIVVIANFFSQVEWSTRMQHNDFVNFSITPY